MTTDKRSPAALAGAHRADNVKAKCSAINDRQTTADPLDIQAAIIAQRYGLSPCMARLICHTAQIGGRLT